MKNKIQKTVLLSLIALSCSLTYAKKETFIIDPLHTNARFTVDHYKTSSNVGGFFELTGNLKYDEKKTSGEY